MKGQYLKRKLKKLKKWFAERPYYIRRWFNLRRIKSRDFTIISNNCWAGKVYQYFDMPYLSPTAGLYFFADDYLKFVTDLRYYLSLELEFIPASESRYVKILEEKKQTYVPIGILDDIEIIFLHYETEQEAKEKWERRTKRINWDNMFIKFSRMNFCTDEHMKKFDELPFENKFMLDFNKKPKYKSAVYWSGKHNEDEIILDSIPFPGNLSLVKLLNKKAEKYCDNSLM